MSAPMLQALLPADHIYRDEHTGKYVVAGTFHEITLETFPGTLGRTTGLFVSLRGVDGDAEVQVALHGPVDEEPLVQSPRIPVTGEGHERTVEFAIELPPLPLPTPGRYELRLAVDDEPAGEAVLEVHQA